MTIDSIQLLRRLEPPVRPACAGCAEPAGPTPLEQAGFADLLQLVAGGQVASGRPVTIGFEPLPALSDDQLRRLASAADLAEAHGARAAVMLIDGRGLVMDVGRRALTLELGTTPQGALAEVDAAVWVEGSKPAAPEARGPRVEWLPPTLRELFQRRDADDRHAVRSSDSERLDAGAPGRQPIHQRPEPTAPIGG